jgi:putative ABC transport system permease protein
VTRLQRLRAAVHSALHRLASSRDAARRAREDEEELQFHLEMATAEHRARGLSAAAARAAARRELGALDAVREEVREQRGLPWLELAGRDLHFAVRALRRAPGFTATVVAVVALGIGAVTAIVPLVDAVLVEPLPFHEPERLVALWETAPHRGWEQSNASPANLLDWMELPAFAGVAGHGFVGGWALGGGAAGAERVTGVQVTGGFFAVLGIRPAVGSDFAPDAHWAGAEPTMIVSDGLWRRRFGGDPRVVGRRVEIDGEAITIRGVAPPGFAYPHRDVDVWMPFGWQPSFATREWFRRAHFVRGFGRLAEGVSADEAAARLAALAAQLERRHPATNEGMGAGLTPLQRFLVGEARPHLLVLLAAVALLLLVACANVASLMFARGTVRAHETALRRARGASRPRLLWQLASETMILAGAGGVLGTAAGLAASRLLDWQAGDALPTVVAIDVDASVVLTALALVVLAGLLFGVGPGLRAAATPPGAALRAAGRSLTAERGLLRSRGTLLLAEVAMAVVLLAGAALAVRGVARLLAVEPGFTPAGRLAISYDLPPARYADAAAVHAAHRRVLEAVRAVPGVAAADLASSLPLEGPQWTSDLLVEGRSDKGVEFARRIVSPGYHETLGVQRLAGPGFPAAIGDDPLVVVNLAMARHVSPGAPLAAVGRRVAIDLDGTASPYWRTVVGVVADEVVDGLQAPPRMEMFVPLGQEHRGAIANGWSQRGVTLVARTTASDPTELAPALREVMRAIDPQVPLYDARTLAGMLAEATARERFVMVLLATFATLALALAVVGTWGLVAFAVAQRRREIGIRLALGAAPRQVAAAVAGQALRFCAAGLGVGLLVAALGALTLRRVLHGMAPTEPLAIAVASAVLAAALVVAAWLPARRATRVDPTTSLRE